MCNIPHPFGHSSKHTVARPHRLSTELRSLRCTRLISDLITVTYAKSIFESYAVSLCNHRFRKSHSMSILYSWEFQSIHSCVSLIFVLYWCHSSVEILLVYKQSCSLPDGLLRFQTCHSYLIFTKYTEFLILKIKKKNKTDFLL